MTNKGLFITLEGMDGCGKTTQTKLLEAYLKDNGHDVILVREPGSTSIGEKIRSIILDTDNTMMANTTEMLLYAFARAQLVAEIIHPAINSGKVVICDRFLDSSLVYQGFGRGISLDILMNINNVALNSIEPDITLFFDISPEVALKEEFLCQK